MDKLSLCNWTTQRTCDLPCRQIINLEGKSWYSKPCLCASWTFFPSFPMFSKAKGQETKRTVQDCRILPSSCWLLSFSQKTPQKSETEFLELLGKGGLFVESTLQTCVSRPTRFLDFLWILFARCHSCCDRGSTGQK